MMMTRRCLGGGDGVEGQICLGGCLKTDGLGEEVQAMLACFRTLWREGDLTWCAASSIQGYVGMMIAGYA
jgi:hypothetical protein